MSDIWFAKTRYEYQSYSDLYRVIELSGYPVCYVDEMDLEDASKTFILCVLNGEWHEGWHDNVKSQVIFWDYEYHGNFLGQYDTNIKPLGISRVWLPDAWLARYHAGVNAEYVLMGGHPGLNPEPERVESPIYDVAYIGYRDVYRRQVVMQQMAALGVTHSPNGWGHERHEALLRSRAYLRIHQWDRVPAMSPQRIAVAAAYRLPVIHEQLADWGAFGYSHLLVSDYSHLAEFTRLWTRDGGQHGLADIGNALYQFLCVENTFRSVIERNV